MAEGSFIENFSIEELQEQIALRDQKIQLFTKGLSQTSQFSHYFEYLDVIPEQAQVIRLWKDYKKALQDHLQTLI